MKIHQHLTYWAIMLIICVIAWAIGHPFGLRELYNFLAGYLAACIVADY